MRSAFIVFVLVSSFIIPSVIADDAFGNLDAVNCIWAGGWTRDPDIEGAINVHFYASEEQGTQGNFIGYTLANLYRADLCGHPNIGCNHSFTFFLPDTVKDDEIHWLRAYAIGVDQNGIPTGENIGLGNTPMEFGPCQKQYDNPDFDPSQGQPISVPPPYTIQSTDGYVTVGVSRRFGGSIVYYNDSRITDTTVAQGNIIDYSNAGTLFTTAIWTLPPDGAEQQFCYDGQKVGSVCRGTIPFNNPTQGGYVGNGYAGNPNAVNVTVQNNRINVSSRPVNYNFAYHTSFRGSDPREPFPLEINREEWQCDFWHDMEIYFHPVITDVLVIETKVTYCKDMDDNCNNKTIVTQDNQLNTLFAAGEKHPNPSFRGPYNRTVYHRSDGFVYLRESKKITDNDEEWVAILKEGEDVGIGVSIQNYQPTNRTKHGINVGTWPSFTHTQPELNLFENSGITRKESVVVDGVTYSDIIRYEFQPGGWYKFKTYVATGSPTKIRNDLMQANQYACNVDGTDGSGICKSYCGSSDECDGHQPGYLIPSCLSPGTQPYHHDMCDSSCQNADRDNLCLGVGHADCTGNVECHLTYARTGCCSQECVYECTGVEGDVNNDTKVDILDIALLSLNIGSNTQSGNWDYSLDVVANGEIDIFDIVFIASRFTESDLIYISPNPGSGGTGTPVSIPILIRDNTNEISAFGLDMTYDTNMFNYVNLDKGDLTSRWGWVDANEVIQGTVIIGGMRGSETPVPASSDGSIAITNFVVTCSGCSSGTQGQFCISNYDPGLLGLGPEPACTMFTYA